MAQPQIVFVIGEGGLGRPLPGKDFVSSFIAWFQDADLPSGFSTSDRVKAVFSIQEAEALGIIEGSATSGVLWYHINRFFIEQPKGKLWIGLYGDAIGTVDFADIETLQNESGGEIRQVGVFNIEVFDGADVTSLQTIASNLQTADTPLSIIYAADWIGTGAPTLSTAPDLRTLDAKNVSVLIGEDGNNDGAALALSEGNSITGLGAVLGAIAFASVNESIAWVGKFNFVKDEEFDLPAMATGELVKDLSAGLLDALNDKGYLFFKKHTGIAGSYLNDSNTSALATSDFAFIENVRTLDKAVRNVRTALLPLLNSPIPVDANTGKLPENTISVFRNEALRPLEQMAIDGEISTGPTGQLPSNTVVINPEQDVLTTSEIEITITLVPVGVARNITVNIGFGVSVN